MILDICCIGSAHLDVYVDTSETFGVDRRGTFTISVGGTAYNISCNLKQLGLNVDFVTALKENSLFTSLVLQKIKESGLLTNKVVLMPEIKNESGFIAFRKNKDLAFAVNSTPIENINLSFLIPDKNIPKLCFLDLNNSLQTIQDALNIFEIVYISGVSESKITKLAKILPNQKIKAVFGNRFEIIALLKAFGIDDMEHLSTNNPNTIFVVTKDKYGTDIWVSGKVQIFEPVRLDYNKIESFSGAGDAFASAFIYALEFLKKDINSSVFFANSFVKQVILSKGANIDENSVLYDFNQMIFNDQLTELYNRRYLDMWLNTCSLPECAVLLFDIDHFKSINDTYGHDVGDIALKEFAKILKNNLRDNDLVVRMGGEEFLVVIDDKEHAYDIAERIRQATENNKINISCCTFSYTVSCGIVLANYLSKEKFTEVYKVVDEALYQAKNSGRNKIIIKCSYKNS